MDHARFSSLSMLHVERYIYIYISNTINVDDIVDIFTETERRIVINTINYNIMYNQVYF